MATFVLVHGAWHGSWCWRKITPLLARDGHSVLTPELPGHGSDHAPVGEMTLESYARRVQSTIESASEPVVLVGHSMSGMTITQVAEYVPDAIARLVYLTATLPADGQSLPDLTGSIEAADQVQPHLIVDEQTGMCVVSSDAVRNLFYNECSEEDVAFAMERLVPESLAAIAAPVHVTADRAGRVPRAYIECLRDHTFTIDLQRHMQAALPCAPVLSIDSDHSPFLSNSAQLAAQLQSLA